MYQEDNRSVLGRATKEGTQRYRERHKHHCAPTFFREALEQCEADFCQTLQFLSCT